MAITQFIILVQRPWIDDSRWVARNTVYMHHNNNVGLTIAIQFGGARPTDLNFGGAIAPPAPPVPPPLRYMSIPVLCNAFSRLLILWAKLSQSDGRCEWYLHGVICTGCNEGLVWSPYNRGACVCSECPKSFPHDNHKWMNSWPHYFSYSILGDNFPPILWQLVKSCPCDS